MTVCDINIEVKDEVAVALQKTPRRQAEPREAVPTSSPSQGSASMQFSSSDRPMSDRDGSEGSVAMEEDQDDDLYGARSNGQPPPDANIQDVDDDEEEEEDSDDEINIVTQREDVPVETAPQALQYPRTESKSQSTPVAALSRDSRPSITTQAKADSQSSRSTAATTLKPGSSYPEVRTSTVDVDKIPEYTLPDGTKKSITEIEIDADLAEHIKPWRRPGTDMTDYFNYGFDEFTWSMYTQKQKAMSGELKGIKDQDEQFKMLMSGGFPGMPGMPPMPGMPGASSNGQGGGAPQGMPGPEQMMEMMNQMMMQQGTSDPSQLDFGAFMQQMQGGAGAAGPPAGPGGGGQNYGGNQNWQGAGAGGFSGGGGRGRGGRRW